MNRTIILIVNGGLLFLCCLLAAHIIAPVLAEALVPAVDSAPTGVGRRGPEQANGWDEREVILQRNLFNASTLAPSVPPPEEDEDYPKTNLSVRLLGTAAAADPEQSRAAVEYLDDRSHHVVGIGDRLKGRAEVIRIERRRLVLLNQGRREELALEEGPAAGAAPSRATRSRRAARARPAQRPKASPRRQAAVEKLGENRFAVPRSDVDSVAANPAALFSMARFLPKFEEGEMVGLQLNGIKSGSLLEQIGLQNGDTIRELNGIHVTGQEESTEVLRQLTDASEFNVTVAGADGTTRQLRYEVR